MTWPEARAMYAAWSRSWYEARFRSWYEAWAMYEAWRVPISETKEKEAQGPVYEERRVPISETKEKEAQGSVYEESEARGSLLGHAMVASIVGTLRVRVRVRWATLCVASSVGLRVRVRVRVKVRVRVRVRVRVTYVSQATFLCLLVSVYCTVGFGKYMSPYCIGHVSVI